MNSGIALSLYRKGLIQRVSVSLIALSLCFQMPPVYADELEDRWTHLQEEEINLKQRHAEDLANRVRIMQRELSEDRKRIQHDQEQIWQEFSSNLNSERYNLQEQLNQIDSRQKMFERELEQKRVQDELTVQEKEQEMQQLLLDMERLRKEVQKDQKALETHIQEIKTGRKHDRAQRPVEGGEVDTSREMVRITGFRGDELLGKNSFDLRNIRSEYYVEIGDVLQLEVWRVKDLTRSVTVRPDGRISMPLVGDLDVAGLSLTEIKDVITERISEYVLNPQVSISVRSFGGRKFIILGEIGGPGVYRFEHEMSLIEAIALAGGFNAEAKSGEVAIIRGDIRRGPKVKIIKADMQNLLKRGMLSENLAVIPGDIIYVGRDYLGDVNNLLEEVVEPLMSNFIDFFVLRSAARTEHQT